MFLALTGIRESVDVDELYKNISFGFIWVKVVSKAGLFLFSEFF